MGSRRTLTRSSSSNGRSSNGDDMSGSSGSSGGSRTTGCSYLSNVRPENRSTLCSVIAQLTEETQPSFETTLKSKAVSENSNVKFSCVVTGYPTPLLIWYKDDMQLDRYCGLPKYEVFRNGQNHSLHIYNCTVEDAAIYQASASNSKGIVACSGVLEVGEMNEYKIHQRYFAKLKQKAENKRREAEGKENQEPLRTISPDRTLRKRRSTMEAFLSTPSSMEDEGNEESHQAVPLETEARLQEAAMEEVEEKLVPITNGAVSDVTNGQFISENGNKSGTYIYDSAQKTVTAHQPKTPFVKKKIKMSNSAPGERASEERRAKDEVLSSVAPSCTESVKSEGNSEEFMEVENSVSSSVADSDFRNVTERHQKSETKEVLLAERPSKDENMCVDQKEQLTSSVPGAAPTPTSLTVSGTEGKKAAQREKEAGRKNTEQNFEMKKQSPRMTPTQRHSSATSSPRQPRSTAKGNISKTQPIMDVDHKSNTSIGGSLAHRDIEPVKAPCESRTASPQHPCEQAGDQLSAKETSPCQKKVSVSQPAPLNEVTQARTKMNRNDAPVSLELLPNKMDVPPPPPPRKTPSQRETTTDDIQTPSLHRGPQAAIDKMTQDTWDHSRGSSEIHTVLSTDIQKSPLQSPSGGEKTRGCSVSSSAQQSRIDTAIKTVEGPEIQVKEKVDGNEVGKLLVQSDSEAPHEKMVEMETESAALHVIEHTETEKTNGAADTDVIIVDASKKETKKNEHILKMAEEASSALQNLKSSLLEPAIPLLTKTSGNLSELQIKDIQEIPEAVTKVISVAELLRSQIKALESTLANSVTALPFHAGFVQDPTTTVIETCEEIKEDDSKLEVKKSMPDRKTEMSVDSTPPRNIKETLMEVYNLLNKTDQELIPSQGVISSPVQALGTPLVIPPISVVDTGTARETAGLHGTDKNCNEGVIMDICQETGVTTLVPMKDDSVVSLSGSENVKHTVPPSTSKDELNNGFTSGTVTQEPGTPPAVTPLKACTQESSITDLEHAKGEPVQGKDMGIMQKSTPETKLNSETEREITEMNSTTLYQYKMEEHDTKSVQNYPTKTGTDTQENNLHVIQQDSAMVEEFSRTDSFGNPTPEASPRLKKRECVSPIPSATPQELASGARRKILVPKAKPEEASEATSPLDNQTQKKEVPTESSKLSVSPLTPLSTSPSLSRRTPLLQPPGEQTPPVERRSPLLSRKKTPSEIQAPSQPPTEEVNTPKTEGKPTEKDKHDPFKAPQVIRKIRGESFADASGHLKLWCQFFNVLSDSTIRWYRNEKGIAQIKRNAGDETQVNLAIAQASCKDSGVYGCTITNEYGTDSTDYLLSVEVLAGLCLREDLGVGEEIEMTPMLFNKGVADSGVWGNKFFGRIMMQESRIGDGCSHKVWRAKVIYGLEPVFESGNTCIIKVRNPIAYGGKADSCLIDRNLEIVKQESKIQNLAREYCKIFSAEARVIENFGPSLEVVPVYLIYRPANTVPYATVEADLTGVYQKYSVLDDTGRIDTRSGSEVEKKCCALQHWIFQWTNGNLLITRLEGVDTKITNVGISVKSTGHQGLSVEGNPQVFEQFVSQHQCNYFCGLLSLRSLKVMDSLLTPTKPKSSRSPLLQRKMAAGSSSPQTGRKAAVSPRLPRKTEQEGPKTPAKQNAADAAKAVMME